MSHFLVTRIKLSSQIARCFISTSLRSLLSVSLGSRLSTSLSNQHSTSLSSQHSARTMNGIPVSAGIVIIGDEIIKGQVQDCNSFFICQRLHQLGVQVETVVTVPDNSATIAKYVRIFSASYTYVITAGGIGPTHDDITYEAIATAFTEKMKIDIELESMFKNHFKERYTDAHRKLSTIPESAFLFRTNGKFPIVYIRNIFILPGVPKFLKLAFTALESHIGNPSMAYLSRVLYLAVDEMSIAAELSRVNELFSKVNIGSYPEYSNNYYKVRIVLESNNSSNLEDCEVALKESLPAGAVVDYEVNPLLQPNESLNRMLSGELGEPLTEALAVCRETVDRYGLQDVCLGFNGGKDCTALLHLWYSVASQHPDYRKDECLQAIYIRSTTPFPEEEMFIEDCIVRYKLKMMRYDGGIKDQLAAMNEQHPNIRAVLMGTRSTDPHGGNLSTFQPTDQGWPELMRVNPLLNFTYSNVWTLLRGLSLPYCSLYDVGYTSLGSVQNTHLNPALRYTDSNGVVKYKPAYTLTDHHLERAGRHS